MFCMREDDFLLLNLVDVNSCEVDQNMLNKLSSELNKGKEIFLLFVNS